MDEKRNYLSSTAWKMRQDILEILEKKLSEQKFTDVEQARLEIENYLNEEKLKKVNVTCCNNPTVTPTFYLNFSFDGEIIESLRLQKHLI